jgi:hypothetical protein
MMKLLGAAAVVGAAVVAGAVALTLIWNSAPEPVTPAPAGERLDLVVLVVTDGGPNTTAFGERLKADGVPYRMVDLRDAARPALTSQFLAGADGPHFQAVVLPSADPFKGSGELEVVHEYERQYRIRQVDAFQWPGAAVGLGKSGYSGPLDGTTGTVTKQGLAGPFGYLRGPVPFEDNAPGKPESYGYLAEPAKGAEFTPLVRSKVPIGTGGVIVGEYRTAGREELVLTFSFNAAQQQFGLLAPGVVEWATRGVHLGYHRNYFSVEVDDIFLSDNRWSVTGDCTPGESCTGGQQTANIRMTPADVDYAVRWQAQHDFALDLVYNGDGSEEAAKSAPGGRDPLTDALLAAENHFRWANHTYSHQFLGCVQDLTVVPWRCAGGTNATRYADEGLIRDEIGRNIDWGKSHGLPLESDELVTGEHSGLRILPQQPQDNPHLAPAMESNGIRWLAADASRMPNQEQIGKARTVPRYPINLFYNVGTAAEEVDEYNWVYTNRADGGSGICTDHPDTTTCRKPIDTRTGFRAVLVPLEARLTLTRILRNDPRPHYVHQANLAEDRLLYPVLNAVLSSYDRLFAASAPLVCQRLSANGAVLFRQTRWDEAVAAGKAGAYLAGGRIVAHAPEGVDVPVTVPTGSTANGAAFGEAYAGSFSAWMDAKAQVTVR